MTDTRLSSTQRAYLFQREKFLEGLAQRAETLFEDGYAVWPTRSMYVFAVTRESKQGEVAYLVNPVAHTCTCPFFTRQQQEPLTDDGSLVPCKHQKGLRKLIRQMAELLKQEGDMPCYFRLRGHWLGVRSALRRQGEDDDSDGAQGVASALSTTPRKEKSDHDNSDARRESRPQPVGGA